MKKIMPILAVVIPCYNEQVLIKSTTNKILKIIDYLIEKNKIDSNSFLYLVDDGSTDNTWNIIEELHKKNNIVKGLKFTKNEGMQIALRAGYNKATILGANCVISIDADLQQDESTIEEFIDKYLDGADIVFGIRNDRNSDTFIKKTTANLYYKLLQILGINIIHNHSDYRLVSKNAIQELNRIKEKNIMLRIFFNSLNLKRNYVYFNIKQNTNRKSNFSFNKMIKLAINGLTSNTLVPLKIVYYIEIFLFLFTIFLILLFLFLFYSNYYQVNYFSTIIILSIFCINFFCISIISMYIKKIIIELKTDKAYITDEELI